MFADARSNPDQVADSLQDATAGAELEMTIRRGAEHVFSPPSGLHTAVAVETAIARISPRWDCPGLRRALGGRGAALPLWVLK